jgi:hypothetical protein
MRLRRRSEPRARTFAAYGVGVQVALEDTELWPIVEEILPPGCVPCDPSEVTETFALHASATGSYTMTVGETSWIEHADLDVAVNALD